MCVICIHVFVITAVDVDGAQGVSRQPDENSTGNKCPETEMPGTGKDGIMQPQNNHLTNQQNTQDAHRQ